MPTDIDADKMEEIQNSEETWVIDFWADWCKPCEKYAPIFEEVAGEMDEVNFGKVDMEEHSSIGQQLGVRALPTTVIVKGGEEVSRNAGIIQADELESWVQENA
ncbi:MAG: thioredoxin family protein [Candidatus Nanohaloarchaea archaeon]